MNIKSLPSLNDSPDIGQTHYLVDANFRTQDQGWFRADKTGPGDLWDERNVGYVFGSGASSGGMGYATDSAAMQAAVDAAIDFRGDKLYVTPGSYSLATAVSVDVPDLRIIGQRRSSPRQASATITAAVTSAIALTAAADRVEMGHLRFVPLTATPLFNLAAGADRLYMHDYFYDARGITGNTGTIFLTAAAAVDHTFSNFVQVTDAAQGPHLQYTTTATCISIRDYVLWHGGGTTLAVALADFQGAATGVEVENGRGNLTGLASSAVTNLVKLFESGGDVQTLSLRGLRHAIGFCAASGLVSLNTAEAAETGVAACYLEVVGGGAGGLGTTFTQ